MTSQRHYIYITIISMGAQFKVGTKDSHYIILPIFTAGIR